MKKIRIDRTTPENIQFLYDTELTDTDVGLFFIQSVNSSPRGMYDYKVIDVHKFMLAVMVHGISYTVVE